MTPDQLEQRGFRWPAPTRLNLPDGSAITVRPGDYRENAAVFAVTEQQKKALRIYHVNGPDRSMWGQFSELEIETLFPETT